MTPRMTLRTVPEAAEFLRVSRKTILRWIRAGILHPAYRLPTGALRIPEQSLTRILGEGRRAP